MEIIVQECYLKDAYDSIDDFKKRYWDKIKNVKKTKREIELINGDVIRFISTQRARVDGLRADVAIGPDAEYITLSSKHEKRIWNYLDLINHFKNI